MNISPNLKVYIDDTVNLLKRNRIFLLTNSIRLEFNTDDKSLIILSHYSHFFHLNLAETTC